jgi:hypothetical protein
MFQLTLEVLVLTVFGRLRMPRSTILKTFSLRNTVESVEVVQQSDFEMLFDLEHEDNTRCGPTRRPRPRWETIGG